MLLYTYTAKVKTLTEDKIIEATNLRSLADQLGISFATARNVVNKAENCVTRRWLSIDRVPRTKEGKFDNN